MTRFVVGSQSTLFPERLDDYLGKDNPVRAALLYRASPPPGTRPGPELLWDPNLIGMMRQLAI